MNRYKIQIRDASGDGELMEDREAVASSPLEAQQIVFAGFLAEQAQMGNCFKSVTAWHLGNNIYRVRLRDVVGHAETIDFWHAS